jgi:hypothetical protein
VKLGPLEVPEPDTWSPGEGAVRFGGLLGEPSEITAPQLVFLAQQVPALVGQVVPITTDEQIIPDGFYRITAADVSRFDGVAIGAGWVEYEVTAAPVFGSESPLVESYIAGAAKATDHTVTPAPFQAVPGEVTFYEGLHVGLNVGANETRDVEGGTVVFDNRNDFGVGPVYSGVSRWQCEPYRWYMGACQATAEVDGSWVPVVGPSAVPGSWRIDNGMVRFYASGTSLALSWWNTTWSPPAEFEITPDTGSVVVDWHTMHVIRTDPAFTSVRVAGSGEDTDGTPISVMLHASIRRGSPWVTCNVEARTVNSWEVSAATPTAVSNQTHGMRQTTAVSGWQWVVTTPLNNDVDTTNGVLSATDPGASADALVAFGIGATHSSWTGQRAIADLHEEWYAAQAERHHIGVQL